MRASPFSLYGLILGNRDELTLQRIALGRDTEPDGFDREAGEPPETAQAISANVAGGSKRASKRRYGQ